MHNYRGSYQQFLLTGMTDPDRHWRSTNSIPVLWRDICGITGKMTFRQLMGLLLTR